LIGRPFPEWKIETAIGNIPAETSGVLSYRQGIPASSFRNICKDELFARRRLFGSEMLVERSNG
jgi:hypothetical protein